MLLRHALLVGVGAEEVGQGGSNEMLWFSLQKKGQTRGHSV